MKKLIKQALIIRNGNTVSANRLPNKAYHAFVDGATALKAKIGSTADYPTVATFAKAKDAEKFAVKWIGDYLAEGKTKLATVELNGVFYTVPETALECAEPLKPTASKGKAKTKTASSTKKAEPKVKTTAKKTASSSKKATPRPLFASTKQYSMFLDIIGDATEQIEDLLGDNRIADKYAGLTDDIMLAVKGDVERMQENERQSSSTKKNTKKTKSSPKKAKGMAFDYSVIKGKKTETKNKALHKFLVSIGIKDSRTPEYQAVWNGRPWA